VVVASDCSNDALVGETPALLISATESAGSAGSADLGVGVERSLAMAGPAFPEGGVEVGRGVLLIPFPLVVGLEMAGAKIACRSAQLHCRLVFFFSFPIAQSSVSKQRRI
jgi:hypothetical protein